MQRCSRRHLLHTVAVAGLGLLLWQRDRTAEAVALENCFWQKVSGPYCDTAGRQIENWCHRCCAGTYCWTEWCELRVVGSC